MTDYSKLSDAQIAEKVARAMGFPDGGMAFIWAGETLGILSSILADLHTRTTNDKFASTPEIIRWLFFGLPAPLIMAKVKERLICDGHSPRIRYNLFAKTWSATFEYRDDLITPKKASAATEARALYEAFLQVTEVEA